MQNLTIHKFVTWFPVLSEICLFFFALSLANDDLTFILIGHSDRYLLAQL